MRISDWSSDVCSSDLFIRLSGVASEGAAIGYTFNTTFLRKAMTAPARITRFRKPAEIGWKTGMPGLLMPEEDYKNDPTTPEERRVGKECVRTGNAGGERKTEKDTEIRGGALTN